MACQHISIVTNLREYSLVVRTSTGSMYITHKNRLNFSSYEKLRQKIYITGVKLQARQIIQE